MRAFSPDFAEAIAGEATTLATCWRLTRSDGVVFGFTDHDETIILDGVACEPNTGATGSVFETSADLAPDNGEIIGALTSERVSADDLAAGRYDGARVEIWRVDWRAPDRRALLRVATIGDVICEGGAFRAELRGPAHRLARPVGRVYQRGCDARLGDRRCGVDLTDPRFTASGSVISVKDAQAFIASGLDAFDSGWFTHGSILWTSGAHAGLAAAVSGHARGTEGASLTLAAPAALAMTAGDSFIMRAGCEKSTAACAGKFDNLINFRGAPFMPGNDVAIRTPISADRNDGGRR